MQELAIFYNLPLVVEHGGERGPIGIKILIIQISVDGGQGDVDLYASYSNMIKWGFFGGGSPPIYLCQE